MENSNVRIGEQVINAKRRECVEERRSAAHGRSLSAAGHGIVPGWPGLPPAFAERCVNKTKTAKPCERLRKTNGASRLLTIALAAKPLMTRMKMQSIQRRFVLVGTRRSTQAGGATSAWEMERTQPRRKRCS